MIFIKTIELGKNFNPDNYEKCTICPMCKSKLEATNEDIKFGSYLEPYYNIFVYEWINSKRYGANITCPVCKNDIGLDLKEEIK